MAVNFPDSPTIGDTFSFNGKTYEWDGTSWIIKVEFQQVTTGKAIAMSIVFG